MKLYNSQHDFVRNLNNERVIKAEIRELVENTRRGRASYHEPVSFTFTFKNWISWTSEFHFHF